MSKHNAPEIITAQDTSQLYLLNRVAQMVVADSVLHGKTAKDLERSIEAGSAPFVPSTYRGEDAAKLINGLEIIAISKMDDPVSTDAAIMMLDEHHNPHAREINDIPQHAKDAELAADGVEPWTVRFQSHQLASSPKP